MDPILRIINYLFQKHNLKNDEYSIDSFFNNGTSFPSFIELIFNEQIQGLIRNPAEQYQRVCNNDLAFAFLLSKNEEIADILPCFETYKEKLALLSLILTEQCFKIDEKKIIDDCNMIVQSLGIKYQEILELQNINCILSLLNVITENKVNIQPETNDIDQIIIDISKVTKVPIVIDKTSTEDNKKFTFLIQILIIFDYFSKEIFQINNNSNIKKFHQVTNEKNQTSENIQQNLKNEEDIFNKNLKMQSQNYDDISDSNEKDNDQKQKWQQKRRDIFEIPFYRIKDELLNFDSSLNEEEEIENKQEEQSEQINKNLDFQEKKIIPIQNSDINSNSNEEQQSNQNGNNFQQKSRDIFEIPIHGRINESLDFDSSSNEEEEIENKQEEQIEQINSDLDFQEKKIIPIQNSDINNNSNEEQQSNQNGNNFQQKSRDIFEIPLYGRRDELLNFDSSLNEEEEIENKQEKQSEQINKNLDFQDQKIIPIQNSDINNNSNEELQSNQNGNNFQQNSRNIFEIPIHGRINESLDFNLLSNEEEEIENKQEEQIEQINSDLDFQEKKIIPIQNSDINNNSNEEQQSNQNGNNFQQKSRDIFEIPIHGRINELLDFDSSLNEEEEENEKEEQKNIPNKNPDIHNNNFDEEKHKFLDNYYLDNNDNYEEEDQIEHSKQNQNVSYSDDDEDHNKKEKIIYNNSEKDDQEEHNKNDGEEEEEEEEEFLSDDFNQEVENDDHEEEYNDTDEISHENLEKEEGEEEDEPNHHELCNFLRSSTIIKLEDKKENLNEIAILKTINSIGLNKFNFSDILEAIKIENIVEFLAIFFEKSNDKSFFDRIIINESSNSSKLKEIVNFLAEKIPIFKYLHLDFSDEIHSRSSAVLLYTKILDLYFLKRTKSEMLNRCETLLLTNLNENDTLFELSQKIKKNRKRRKDILLDWNTYLALVYFVNEGKVHFQKNELSNEKYSFEKKQIPQIIDEKYLQQTEIDSSPLYYQLQFIFDELNKQGFCQYFIESILICTRKLNQIKVPKYCSTIANDMIPKHKSLVKYKRKNDDEDEEEDDGDDNAFNESDYYPYEFRPVKGKNIIHRFIGFESLERVSPLFYYEEQQNRIEKFNDRYLDLSMRFVKSLQHKRPGELQPAKKYWNAIYDKSKYKKGIFVSSQDQQSDLYDAAICNLKKTPINMQDECNKKIIDFLPKIEYIEKFPIFKFFVYSEEEMKWNINNSAIDSFIEKMHINPKKDYTPLVLCFNSNTDDLMALNSNLIDYLYPNRKSKQIFVFPLYGRALESLIATRYRRKKIVEKRNPIYLLLHVPESKKELENINIIIYQIYYFLSIICDIEILVLNKNYYKDQMNLLEKFDKIKDSYDKSISSLNQLKNFQSSRMVYLSYKNFRTKKENIDNDSSSDGDESEDENDTKNKKDNKDDQYDDILATMDFSNLFINLNYIILINSENISGYNKWTDTTPFVKSLEKQISNSKFHFINVNEPSTYVEFLTTLNQLCFNCVDGKNEESFDKFRFYPLSNACAYFIQYKLGIENQTPLKTMIDIRFNQMLDYIKKWENELYFLSELDKEILKTYPSIDDDYFKECNSIISSIKDEKASKKKEVIINELGKSSKSSINYWKNKIQQKDYLSKIDRDNIKISHLNFLQSEYFDIVSKLFQIREITLIFDQNLSILSEQIKEDNLVFEEIFKDFDDRIKLDNQQKVKETIYDLKDKATNYMIREKENVREIKVIVEAGKLDEVFESDF